MLEVVLVVTALAVAAAIVRQVTSDSCYDLSDGERHPHKWGYTDTRFEFDGPKTVRVTGSRYPIAGFTMPHFIPFVEEMLQVPIDPNEMAVEKEAKPCRPREQTKASSPLGRTRSAQSGCRSTTQSA